MIDEPTRHDPDNTRLPPWRTDDQGGIVREVAVNDLLRLLCVLALQRLPLAVLALQELSCLRGYALRGGGEQIDRHASATQPTGSIQARRQFVAHVFRGDRVF